MSAAFIIFVLSIAFILYVLIGYPALLAGYARIRPKLINKEPCTTARLSIIIPVRNGASWIIPKLESLLASEYPPDLIDVLVVSDGSNDGTDALVADFGDPRIRLLALPAGGKAVAVSAALERVTGDLVVLTDVRQQFDRQALSRLVACFKDPKVGVVTGELVIRQGSSSEEYNTGLYWRYEKWIRRNLNRVDAMLGATGAIYAIRRELAASIPAEILLDDVYLPFVAAFQGFRIYFEDAAKAYDFPTSLQSEFRRKVRTQAGIYQILMKFPGLLWPGNQRFIHFLSHKIGRLLLPFAMISALCSSLFITEPWRGIALLGQALFYGAGLVDPMIPENTIIKRITAVVRAFLVLTAAALCAIIVFFLPAQRLWKETRVGLANKSTV
jgi:biofilm PGA synthesis N-glycosyltransferase PgaC